MDVPGKTNSLPQVNSHTQAPHQGTLTTRLRSLSSNIVPVLVRNRQRTLFTVIVVLLILEIIEHLITNAFGNSAHELFDAVLYVFLVPAGTWIFLALLDHSETERVQSARASDMQSAFSQQLGSARTWDDLIREIVRYPHEVAPSAAVTLYIYNKASLQMQPEAACSREGEISLRPQAWMNTDTLPASSLHQTLPPHSTEVRDPGAESTGASDQPALPCHHYDLPVTRNDQSIGTIRLEYLDGSDPDPQEIQTLESALPLIALALEVGLLQTLAAEQAAASEAERQEIAQNLHDTLAQNISYLRLKLDQLTGENAIREIGAVLQELERMRTTADEAYQQVRNTLDELGPIHAEDVMTSVTKQAQTISARAGFTLRTTQSGTPYALPALARQQILYIVREALHNVEKHAQASRVHLQFTWLESELILKVTDDGVGFHPPVIAQNGLVLQDGHYGLWIMQQRAEDIGGTLKICPSTEQGTEVTLWVPRPVGKP